MDGRIKRANASLFENEADLHKAPAGEVVFDPAFVADHWPENFTAYKSGLVGQALRIVTVGAWDAAAQQGFELIAFAAPQPSTQTVYVRFRQYPDAANDSAPRIGYYGSEPCLMCLTSASDFYVNMVNYVQNITRAMTAPTATSIRLPYADRRQVDMVTGTLVQALTVFIGLSPNCKRSADVKPKVDRDALDNLIPIHYHGTRFF